MIVIPKNLHSSKYIVIDRLFNSKIIDKANQLKRALTEIEQDELKEEAYNEVMGIKKPQKIRYKSPNIKTTKPDKEVSD